MKPLLITFCFFLLVKTSLCQQNYDAASIPKELLSHASAVIRDEESVVTVEDLDNTLFHYKLAVTILNKNGDDMAHIELDHDKSKTIKYIKGAVYNEFGKQIGKFSEGDFEESNAWDGFSLFLGTRIKHYSPSVTEYPYTIVYEYEVRLKQSLDFPQWWPVSDFGIAVENSSYTFMCKPDFNIRYKETNVPSRATIGSSKDGLKTYVWKVGNMKAVREEPFSPYSKNYFCSVQIAPEKFSYFGITGSYTNWATLGKWEYEKLVASRQELPPETIAYVKELTKNISDPKLKAKKIYEYMQGKTHYVSVQVGIGGWQPFLAADVDQQNYGDCKALVNYTQALLKAVGVNSYYCVVESGRKYKVGLLKDFASMDQGNHIILCLPFKNDTTWADCTSQTIPFGYLGDFTDDRDVLACTPDGGKLMHTPKYTAQDNLKRRIADFTINDAGELFGNMVTTFKGTDYEDREYLLNESATERNKMIQRVYPINNLGIENLDIKQDKSFDPVTTEKIKLHAIDYASLNDGKYYFMVNPASRNTEVPKQVFNRTTDVYINRGYTREDEITYTLPANYHLEKDPLNVVLDKPFGKFSATMQLQGNKLVYKRKIQIIDGTYPKDMYQDLVDFYQSVADADEYTVSLTKNQ